MELKLFLSGVPLGENLWGDQNENSYFGTLYVPSKENHKFEIRLRKNSEKIYAYYHYLVYNTINDYDGRTGSYFGITVRLDSYCSDYNTIYNVLDIVYKKKIIGLLLKEANGGRLQYSVPIFEKKDSDIVEIEKFTRNLLGTSLTSLDFRNIPSMPTGKGIYKMHFEDATIKGVMQAVGQTASCTLSFEFDSQKTINGSKEAFKLGEESKQKEIFDLKNQIEELKKKEKTLLEELNKPIAVTPNSYSCEAKNDYEEHFSSRNYYDFWGILGKVLLILDFLVFGIWVYYTYIDSKSIRENTIIENKDDITQAINDQRIADLFNLPEEFPSITISVIPDSLEGLYFVTVSSSVPNMNANLVGTNCSINKEESKYRLTVKDMTKPCIVVYTDENKSRNYKKQVVK